jgi:hypothetical protein
MNAEDIPERVKNARESALFGVLLSLTGGETNFNVMEDASKDVLVTLAGTAQLEIPFINSCWNITFVHNYQPLFKLRLSSQIRTFLYPCSSL